MELLRFNIVNLVVIIELVVLRVFRTLFILDLILVSPQSPITAFYKCALEIGL